MNKLYVKDTFVKPGQYSNNQEIETVVATDTVAILSGGAFKDCNNLKEVYFGLDITRIGNGTFDHCRFLSDVYFGITDENKIIEIADDAFRHCETQITFHIFASPLHNPYLNEYARKHDFNVVGLI